MTIDTVSFPSDGLKLSAAFADTGNPETGLVIFHGAGKSDKSLYHDLQEMLMKHDIASMAFDFRGCGESDGMFSEGSIANRITDAANAVRQFRRLTGLPDEKIVIMGSSMGGHIACRIVGMYPAISAIVLTSAAAYGRAAENKPLGSGFTAAIAVPGNWNDSQGFTDIEAFPGPVFAAYGSDETVIPGEIITRYGRRAERNGKSIMYPGGKHALFKPKTSADGLIRHQLMRDITDFILALHTR